MSAVFTQTIRRERRNMVGWIGGIAALVLVTAGSWPAVESSGADLEEIFANLPEALTAFFGEGLASFSAAGIVGSRLYGTIGLLVAIGFAVSRGARAIAGEEEDGTLELLVTLPISRRQIAVDKLGALLVTLGVLIGVETILLLAISPLVGLDFSLGNILGASLGLFLLAMLFGALAFTVGCATGGRGTAVAIAAGTAGGLFILTGLSGLVDQLSWVKDLSPFARYDGAAVLSDGLNAGVAVGFVVAIVLMIAVGLVALDHRDLS